MIRRLLLTSILFSFGLIAWSQTSLEGKVTDATTGEALIFANVVIFKNGNMVTGTQTDLDGNYVFANMDPGTYDIEVHYTGYPTQRQTNVVVLAGKAIRLNFAVDAGVALDVVVVTDYKVPLIEQDNTTQGGIKTAEQIRNLPTKSINAIAATTAGLSSIDGDDVNIRGSRTNATNYYIDGMRVSGTSLIPQSEIEQLQVITGGMEARYGDVTGGLISLTTKGPTADFTGSVEVESSELTDPYGYNLFVGNVSGPILKNKTTDNTIIGFRLSGQYRSRDDRDPQAYGGYRATEEAIARISAAPVTLSGAPILLGERLEESDVELLKSRPNIKDEKIDITGKLDFRLSNAIDFTLGGNYFDYNNHFSPNRAWNLLNWQHNPYEERNGFIFNARFRHRIGASPSDPAAPATTASVIKNISYTLQYGFEKQFFEEGDDRFRENLFHYGYVGEFDVTWEEVVGLAQDTSSPFAKPLFPGSTLYGEHFGYGETFTSEGYKPSTTINPLLANYNIGQDVLNFRDYNAHNGSWSTTVNSIYSGIHTATGAIYNRFAKSEDEIHTGNMNASFDFSPGGSDKGRHSIQFGLLYEQRHNRFYGINPRDLWNTMRLAANNKHIIGLDSNKVIGVDTLELFINGVLTPFEICTFETLVQEQPSLLFYKKVRELTGQSLNEYVNIDGLNPDDLSLDMFAAGELTDRKAISYYGYDYLGNKLPFSTTFDDFFTAVDAEGRRTLPVAGNRPIYTAAYIQDKFTFRDIIFRLGLRVDRYDANTKVLKDPYSLYEIVSADDFFNLPETGIRPPAVQDDWKVYVVSEGSKDVRAFRDGDQWYTAEGSPVNDGSVILGNEIPNPYYVEQNSANRNIRSLSFNPNQSFEDYKPQINWMPRLAFSFPISDEANFFVHYDVLVQRPPSNTIATALDYYYWSDGIANNGTRDNPDLKPEKTIDFEIGFKQKITNSSAITLSSYYKELRDMIQSRTYLFVPGVPGNSYKTFGNQDFGTVKGFSFSYDLRRTQNLEMTAAYTLQFADGTGSSATTQNDLTLNSRGNLRYLSPLSFDERHRLSANIDYRYGRGSQYNGPVWFGADVFSNAGISLQASAASGRPYTKRVKPQRFGGQGIGGAINGARLPWNFGIDLRADKSFRIGGEESTHPLFANVYLRIENVLDTRNIIGVYNASGSAFDDGYLATPEGASALKTLVDTGRPEDVDNYFLSYQWGMLNSNFFTMPRRVYLGATLQF